jgi:hypothetical protein
MAVRAGVLAAMLVAGCTGAGGDPPRRPAVAVADDVNAVDGGQVVGTWQCRELNPLPEIPQQIIVTTYEADGTFLSESRSAPRPPLGAMLVTVRGWWAVEGDRIVTSGVTTEAHAADGDAWTDMMAGLGASFVNSLGERGSAGAGEVLRLGAGELVLRPLGVEDPPVIACTR